MKASQKLGEAMYAQSQAEAQAAGGAGGQGGDGSGAKQTEDEKVVDAEFTEVKDKK
jgi:molecular chaperone DnaK